MLKIQRASAGSGKTYTLARQFILNLIAFKTEGGKWILRNQRQMEDALQHILAITFTNKATNEMKQRIIDNLALLAEVNSSSLNPEKLDKIPYLKDFCKITSRSPQDIAETAEEALKVILNNYSIFKISTIDSFFQEILRIFTYEANINNSYQLEIDSSFVTESALDAAINELDMHPLSMGAASFWLKTIMREEATKSQMWNVFNKKNSARSIYARIRKAISQLEKEEYKDIKQKLENYFKAEDKSQKLIQTFSALRENASRERETLLKAIKGSLAKVDNLMLTFGKEQEHLSKTFLSHLDKIRDLQQADKINFSFNKILNDGSVFLKKYRTDDNPLDTAALDMYNLLQQWSNPPQDSYYKSWNVYGELIPYLGIILEIRKFLQDVLETNNLIQLSDTSFILKKIIGEDDAPFVYERLGNKIDNYLIDEFQDTSRMQWDIISPLLREGLSKNKESLIIGDPKQSIYRFRNADHKLITDVVPNVFPFHEEAGYSREENTNWRSATKIVKFNNFVFRNISHNIAELSNIKGGGMDFKNLYSNVVQYPANQDDKGYIEIRIYKQSDQKESVQDNPYSSEEEKDWFETMALDSLGPLIDSLISRGYSQKDIGVLVNTNENGKKIIDYLIAYNGSKPDDTQKIDFLSEESLLVASSSAVEILLGILEKLTKPDSSCSKNEDGANSRYRYLNWNELQLNYRLFSKQHADREPVTNIMEFLSQKEFDFSITDIVNNLPTPSLSSMVEMAIETFIDESLRKTDALYISAFQDIVSEYCLGHLNDPASFLEWWQSRGYKMTITSPEDIDAVQIMTIHKSKGLEFKCVIIPFASDSLLPSAQKAEWRWVTPHQYPDLEMPPVLPVKTNSSLLGSIHENVYKEFVDQVLTDKVNMYYVAFTRAQNELYIFAKKQPRNSSIFSDYLINLLSKEENFSLNEKESSLMIDIDDVNMIEEEIIHVGEKYPQEFISEEKKKKAEKKIREKSSSIHIMEDYVINKKRPGLRSLASRILPSGDMVNF